MSEDNSAEDSGAALLRQLMGRRARPGMVDVAGIREAGRPSAPGLGLANSPLAQRLGARRTGDTAGAMTGAELTHPVRRMVAEGIPAAEPDVSGPAMSTVRPAPVRARPSMAATLGLAGAGLPSSPIPSAAPAARTGAILPMPEAGAADASALSLMLDGGSARSGSSSARSGGGSNPVVPQVQADANPDVGAEASILPLVSTPRLQTSAAYSSFAAGRASASATPRFEAPVSMPTLAASPVTSTGAPPRLDDSLAHATASSSPSGYLSGDLSEQVQRDLMRRLAVERERQGLPRWKR